MYKVAPSILSADFSKLALELESINNADFIHIDVMDGHFVPNITIGPVVIKNLNKKDMIFDVHLMISDPKKYTYDFIQAGADYITFHFEAMKDKKNITELIDYIHSFKKLVGISVKPNTNPEVLKPYLDKIDLVLVMSVEPGFGGQQFMPNALDKIKYYSNEKKLNNYNYLIEVDGGINKETSALVKEAGVEVIVAGTYIFKNQNRKQIIEELSK